MKLSRSEFQFVAEIAPGAEATRMTRVLGATGESLVAKSTDATRAFEESLLILKSNAACPGTYPAILRTDYGASPGYLMRHIEGTTLQAIFQSSSNPIDDTVVAAVVERALHKIRTLHVASTVNYTSRFHEVIVIGRLRSILRCPAIEARLGALVPTCRSYGFVDVGGFEVVNAGGGRLGTPAQLFDSVARCFDRWLPRHESLIHGDPHFGNILVEDGSGEIFFIDPRCTWDGQSNPKQGYFDPLYDAAAIVHSFVANHNVVDRCPCEIDTSAMRMQVSATNASRFDRYRIFAQHALRAYLGRAPTLEESIRFFVYLGCSLSGTMRYPIWTPHADNLWSMYLYTFLFLDMVRAQMQSPGHRK